jgi:hypothetical protein
MSKAGVDINIKTEALKDLEDDLYNLGVAISREVAMYAKTELTVQYRSILQDYYADYNPVVYERTNQLLNDSYSPYYKSPHGTISYGGVLLRPERLEYKTGYPGEDVISDFLNGWHGGSIPAGFNPYMRLLRRRDVIFADICDGETGQNLIKQAKKKVNLKVLQ